MRKHLIIVVTAAALALPVSAQQFELDSSHSHFGFGVRHMTVSTVRGEFTDFDATLDFDSQAPADSSVQVTIEAVSLHTRNEQRDNHLRSEDFFDAANHPQISFTSTSIAPSGEGYDVTGDLTIRGTTKEVVLPVEVMGPITDSMGRERLGVSGQLTIDRNDFGVAWSRALEGGGLVVGNEVKIVIEAEFVHQAETEESTG